MKSNFWLCVFIFLLFSASSYSQEKRLFGMGPFDWTISKEMVKQIMEEKYHLIPGYEKDDAIGYQGGNYSNQDLHLWVFFFNDSGLNEIDLVVKNNNRPVAEIFYQVVHTLTEEYGDPDLFKPNDWTAEWFYFDHPGKRLNATIKISPYSNDEITSIKIAFLKID